MFGILGKAIFYHAVVKEGMQKQQQQPEQQDIDENLNDKPVSYAFMFLQRDKTKSNMQTD